MFGRYLRRSECTTMPEYFGARYCDLKNRRVAGIITAVSLTAYLLSCITGVGILMQELTGLSYELCLFLAWFCFTAFTFYSGSKGVILTDTMMFMVFLIATIIAGPYVFKAQGGIGHLLENLMNNPNIPENLLQYSRSRGNRCFWCSDVCSDDGNYLVYYSVGIALAGRT